MVIPGVSKWSLPLLETAAAAGCEIDIKEAAAKVADAFGLSEEEKVLTTKTGQFLYLVRANFATTWLYRAGLVSRPRPGFIAITPTGQKALDAGPDTIDDEFLCRFEKYREWRERSRAEARERSSSTAEESQSEETALDDRSPEERMTSAYLELRKNLKEQILENLLSSSPEFFEKMLGTLLKAMGYGDKAEHTGRSGDGGIDGVVREDKLGLGFIYYQAKRYARDNKVPIGDVRQFNGSLEHGQKGVFFTTSSFSDETKRKFGPGHSSIVLVNGDELAELMIDHNVGVRPDSKSGDMTLKKIDEDFFPVPESHERGDGTETQSHQVRVKKQPKERVQAGKRAYDTTQYLFNGEQYGKRQIVLAVIQKWVADNQPQSYADLLEAFPSDLHNSRYMFVTLKEALDIAKQQAPRHFRHDGETIKFPDGTEYAVTNQWRIGNIEKFLDHARDLGFTIRAID